MLPLLVGEEQTPRQFYSHGESSEINNLSSGAVVPGGETSESMAKAAIEWTDLTTIAADGEPDVLPWKIGIRGLFFRRLGGSTGL
ncbi:MAG TPA: hypothetical protein VGE57_05420 [Solimonas sp.]